MGSRIVSTGRATPRTAVSNDDLSRLIDTSDEWIRTRTGIGARYLMRSGESLVEVAADASRIALERAGLKPGDLDAIIVGTVSSEYAFPSFACSLQTALGADTIPAFDVAAACSGFVYALSVADSSIRAGDYRRVLVVMRHPTTHKRLKWQRVLDYYHASQRVWTMAESLFGKGRGAGWARKMLKWLLLPSGVNRVLHSAAAHQARVGLRGKRKQAFAKAYGYLRKRMKYLQYAEYRSQGMPVGSGVTEAGCKTVYTQRLKLSGQRWEIAGAQVVLDLRVLLLSGIWDRVFLASLKTAKGVIILTNEPSSPESTGNAA